jgi:hypothetical protein
MKPRKDFDPKDLDKDWLIIVKQNGSLLKYIPDSLITSEICLEAVKENGHSLTHVPMSLRTLELCLEAVKQTGVVLEDVPEEVLTYELCAEAVKRRNCDFLYIPREFKNSKQFDKFLSKQEILERYSIEELLTSDKPYLRKLGASNE